MSLRLDPKTGEWIGITGGVDLQELANRKPVVKKQEIPQRDRQEEIRQEILKNENYAYALRLVEYISHQMNLKMGKSIFRNRAASCYNPETKQIWFSYENIDKSVKYGFSEYSTVGHVWINNGYKPVSKPSYWRFEGGKKAVWMIVIHEMAHRVQHDKQCSFRGDHHGQIFLQELNDLIILFPYSECQSI